jgi:hypothetical protein
VIFVLVHAYYDRSGFNVCGVTDDSAVAKAWYQANDENDIYEVELNTLPACWNEGLKGWREMKMSFLGPRP